MDSEIILYQTEDGETKIQTRLENETVWLTQAQMAELFGKGRSTITEHIGNVFQEGELEKELVSRKFRHTTVHGAIEGKTQETESIFYNLDVIISVGYRVKSMQGTKFDFGSAQSPICQISAQSSKNRGSARFPTLFGNLISKVA